MQPSWYFLAVVLAWTHSVSSNPLGPVAGNQGLNLPPASPPPLRIPIPPTFKFRPMVFRPVPSLPPEAFWLNAMVATQAAASGDFDSTMPLTAFRSQRFGQPVVRAITPPPETSTTIIRKYMIWGVWLSILYMEQRSGYGLAVFGLEYGDEELGVITFVGPSPPPPGSNAVSGNPTTGIIPPERRVLFSLNSSIGTIESTSVTVGTAGSTTNDRLASIGATMPDNLSTATNTTSLQSRSLTVDFIYTATYNIPKTHALSVLLNAVADTASLISDADITGPWVSMIDEDEHFQIRAIPTLLRQALGLKYADVAAAMVKAADWMIENNRYRCFKGLIKVDGMLVGQVLFQHIE